MKKLGVTIFAALLLVSALSTARAFDSIELPEGFEVTLLASDLEWSPKGIVSPLHRAGAGPFGHYLYVALSSTDQIVTVDKSGAGASLFTAAFDPLLNFPVGVAFSGGPFGNFLYVGNAYGGGIVKIDPGGNVSPFALTLNAVAGLDFGRGPYGNDMYVGEWATGNIWRVDPAGNAVLFNIPVPGTQTRYLKFSHDGAFGTYLYFTDYPTGDIYQVDTIGNAILFASTADIGLEGFDFSPGGAFGHFLYAGSLVSGKIYQVAPDGTVTLWASGFAGAADIHFEPGKRGGFTMYVADGVSSAYAISKAKK